MRGDAVAGRQDTHNAISVGGQGPLLNVRRAQNQ